MTKKLLTLNGIAIICVILYHSAGWGFVAMFWWTHRYLPVSTPNFDQIGSLSYYTLRLIEQLVIFAIPAFLVVSGYFVAFATGRNQERPKWTWLKNRLKFLVIPYLIWAVVMLLLNIFEGTSYSFSSALIAILTGKTADPYYFVPLIIQLFILSMLITPVAKHRPVLLLIISAIFLLLVRVGQYAIILDWQFFGKDLIRMLLPSWLFPGNLFWFVLGLTAGFHFKKIQDRFVRLRLFFLVGALILIPLGMWEWEVLLINSGQNWFPPRETLLDNLYSFFILASFVSFSLRGITSSKLLNNLGAQSFGIYLSHTLVLTLMAKVIYHYFPLILSQTWFLLPVLVISGLGIPLLMMAIVRRSPLNKWFVYLFG